VSAFSNLAKETNTVLLPSDTGNMSNMVAQVCICVSNIIVQVCICVSNIIVQVCICVSNIIV